MDISLNFMPSFFSKHAGITYGEDCYKDPEYRGRIECSESLFLHDALGRLAVGEARPRPSGNISIQPVDLVMGTRGAEWRMPADATLESWGRPWAGLSAALAALDARAAQAQLLRQQGMSIRRIAKQMGLDITTVKGYFPLSE